MFTVGWTPRSRLLGHVVVPCLPRTGAGPDGAGGVTYEWRTLCRDEPATSVLSGPGGAPVLWCLRCMSLNARLDLALTLEAPLG